MPHQQRAHPSRWRHLLSYTEEEEAPDWTPAQATTDGSASPEHWLRSDDAYQDTGRTTPCTSDGDVVGSWTDKATNADHISQATTANKPTWQNGVGDQLNGHPVIRGDGIDDYIEGMFTTGGALSQPFTVFVVAKLDAAQAGDSTMRSILDSDDAQRMIHAQNTSNIWTIYAGTYLNGGASNSNWIIWTSLFNGATSRFWHNGVAQCAAGDAGANTPGGACVFTLANHGGDWCGDCAEILIYEANLSDADKNQVANYLAERYNLSYTDIS